MASMDEVIEGRAHLAGDDARLDLADGDQVVEFERDAGLWRDGSGLRSLRITHRVVVHPGPADSCDRCADPRASDSRWS